MSMPRPATSVQTRNFASPLLNALKRGFARALVHIALHTHDIETETA